jgi:hypothetical protein
MFSLQWENSLKAAGIGTTNRIDGGVEFDNGLPYTEWVMAREARSLSWKLGP